MAVKRRHADDKGETRTRASSRRKAVEEKLLEVKDGRGKDLQLAALSAKDTIMRANVLTFGSIAASGTVASQPHGISCVTRSSSSEKERAKDETFSQATGGKALGKEEKEKGR